jgi:hypothetical protein
VRLELSLAIGARKKTPLIYVFLRLDDERSSKICLGKEDGRESPLFRPVELQFSPSGTVTFSAKAVADRRKEASSCPEFSRRWITLMRV